MKEITKKIEIPNWLRENIKKALSKKIGFSDVIIITITAISLIIIYNTREMTLALAIWRFIFMLPLLYITALLNDSQNGKKGSFTSIWVILSSGLSFQEKQERLKRQLSISNTRWLKYWRMFETIVQGDETVNKKIQRLKQLGLSIIQGEISFAQIIWITMYAFYSIIITSNVLNIPAPYDIMINIGFLTILRYAAGDYKGMFSFMFDIMNAIAFGKNEKEIEQGLFEIKERIKDDCYTYYFLDNCIIENTEKKKLIR